MIPLFERAGRLLTSRPFSKNKNGPYPMGPFIPIIYARLSIYSENLYLFPVHILRGSTVITISGKLGDDAKQYQEKEVQLKIKRAKK